MDNPRDHAIQVEVKKVHLRQSKEGTVVSFVLHPHDPGAQRIISAPVGQVYTAFFVETTEEGQPSSGNKSDPGGNSQTRSAAMLCRDTAFQNWLVDNGMADTASEDGAAAAIYKVCGVTSRKLLDTDEEARRKWLKLKGEFTYDVSKRVYGR